MNNKGQVLVLFIMFIPIILFILFIVVDLGNLYLKKEHLCNITYDAISYKLDGLGEEEVITYIKKNDNDILVVINDNSINTSLIVSSIVPIMNLDEYEISCKYSGEVIDNKKKIERIK